MKTNMMVIGMLVASLTIPTYSFAQAEVVDSTAAVPETTIAPENTSADMAAPAKEKKVREPRVQKIDSTHYSYGSMLTVHFGLGMSGLWATNGEAQLKNSMGFPGFNLGIRYSYYFLSWLGITTGLDYSTYRSTLTMEGIMDWKSGVKNNQGNEYIHRLNFSGEGPAQSKWEEIEDLSMLEVPIALSFKYKPNKVGLITNLGVKLAFPVKGRYSYKGTLNHIGYDKTNDYWEFNDMHFLANDSYDETFKDYAKSTWSVINASVFGEIGALFQVNERVDLSLSVYGSYCANDINATPYKDRIDLGFRTNAQAARAPEMKLNFMPAYGGLIGNKAIDHINPWNFGVKIGVHIYCSDLNDAERAEALAKQNQPLEPNVVYVRDTVREVTRDTVKVTEVIRDTIEKKVIVHDTTRVQIEQVTKMLEKVIIYYKSGDSKTPIIKPSNLLDDAAAVIAANPSIRVSVEGHASSDGNPQFNQMLSENRALNVAAVLREKGVKDSQIEIHAYGSDHPLRFGNQSDPNKDRRVEIIPIQ